MPAPRTVPGLLTRAVIGTRWHLLRKPSRACDEAVTGTTRRWLRELPPRRRPLRLCAQFPRVANRIAWHWADFERSTEVLEDLLTDRRGGRRGFPPVVARELQGLCEFHLQMRVETQEEGAWARAVRVVGLR